MKKQHLQTLAAVTILLLAAAIWTSQQRAPQTGKATALLLPSLQQRINDIDGLIIKSTDSELNIHRQDGEWRIRQLDDYPARFEKVKQTILATSELEVLANKTGNPSLYARLGVEDISEKNATSHLLTLLAGDEKLASLIVGKPRRSKSPSDQPGLYVRMPAAENALLVSGELPVSAKSRDWFNRNVIDISADEIRLLTIEQDGSEPVVLLRKAKGTDLMLKNIPEGWEAQADAIINQPGTVLENVFADGVKRDINLQDASPVSTVIATTFAGLVIHARLVRQGDDNYVLFTVTANEPAAGTEEADADAAQGEATGGDTEEQPDPVAVAEELDTHLSRWGYLLPDHKVQLFKKSLPDLTREKSEASDEATE